MAVPLQSGALPWRVKRKSAQVMLVTGKRSGRWIIPKGWPMAGKSLADSAAQEAFEEAGVTGKVDLKPIGSFRHVKDHILLGALEVDIQVHPLAVEKELGDCPSGASARASGSRSRRQSPRSILGSSACSSSSSASPSSRKGKKPKARRLELTRGER